MTNMDFQCAFNPTQKENYIFNIHKSTSDFCRFDEEFLSSFFKLLKKSTLWD